MKKGFTLIELLAVIVVLTVLTLIAIPKLTNIIEKTNQNASFISADGYVEAVEKQIVFNVMNEKNIIQDGLYELPLDSKYNIKVKGQKPTNGWIKIINGKVENYLMVIGNYEVSYNASLGKTSKKLDKSTENIKKPNESLEKNDEKPKSEDTKVEYVSKSFSEDSFEIISYNIKNNKLDNYKLGDTKEIDLGSFGKQTIRIVNMSTPDECSSKGFSLTSCGFVVEFVGIINNNQYNTKSTNVGGWDKSNIRTYLNDKIYNAMPEDLKKVIIDTTVISSHGSTSAENNFTSTDKIYLFSTNEIYGKNGTSNKINYDTTDNVTRQLDYYKEKGINTTKYSQSSKKLNGNNKNWWLRSVVSNTNNKSYYVRSDGGCGNAASNNSYGVSPAFRIG